MYAPLSLQHSSAHRMLFQVQRQKIVFADYLLSSWVAAAGCGGPADRLEGLTAPPSKHAFSFLSMGWPSVWCRALVGRARGPGLPLPAQHLCGRAEHQAVRCFCCRPLRFKQHYVRICLASVAVPLL